MEEDSNDCVESIPVDDCTNDSSVELQQQQQQHQQLPKENKLSTCGFREIVKPNVAAFTRSVRSALDWLDVDPRIIQVGRLDISSFTWRMSLDFRS